MKRSTTIPALTVPTANGTSPFNSSTTIEFAVPNRSSIELAVYNPVGEEISVLVRRELAAGYYRAHFDAANLPSGVYFCRIVAGSYIETKKMLLMK
jgi:hypothetical protein